MVLYRISSPVFLWNIEEKNIRGEIYESEDINQHVKSLDKFF